MPSGAASAESTAMSRWPSIACKVEWRKSPIVAATMATRTITLMGVAGATVDVRCGILRGVRRRAARYEILCETRIRSGSAPPYETGHIAGRGALQLQPHAA